MSSLAVIIVSWNTRELLRLFEETKSALRDQNKDWRSLERWQWMDGEIRFWLNPTDQENYRSGWFSIDDLIGWLGEVGPIVVYPRGEDEEEDEDLFASADGVQITWLPDERTAEARLNVA